MKTPRFRIPACHGLLAALALGLPAAASYAQAQPHSITAQQRATAERIAQSGVPLAELAPSAPDEYTVKRGDTLWDVARLLLRNPWRWPELWGMNLQDIRNPHLIYPGQMLHLDKSDGRARLSVYSPKGAGGIPTVKLSPRVREESVAGMALPALKPHLIEPFLDEPIVVEQNALDSAPRIVAGNDGRVLLSRGDRAYARGPADAPLVDRPGPVPQYRIFRNATPLVDPGTGEVLGYEAQYLGKARLRRSESIETQTQGGASQVAAALDIVGAREEIRAGDRLLPEPSRQLLSYVPHAPQRPIEGGRIVSVYGNAVQFVAQYQVVAINKGLLDGIESGNVLAIVKNGGTIVDRTGGTHETLKLPGERIGLLMVFRPFDRVSYALVLEINDTPSTGDLLVNP